mgnify:CR=1 FL=1
MNAQTAISIVGAFVSVSSAVVAVIFGWLSIRNARLSTYAQTENEVETIYSNMVDFRVSHPVVMSLSRAWKPDKFSSVYNQGDETDDSQWVTYYSYAELCIGYCNMVLAAWYQGRMEKSSFLDHHRPLVKLLLTENYPLVENLISTGGKYLSNHIQSFVAEMSSEGWNWEQEHKLLAEE